MGNKIKSESKLNKEIYNRITVAMETDNQAEIARRLNVVRTAPGKWRSGSQAISIDILLLISEQTGYSMHWILTEEGPETVDELKAAAGQPIDIPNVEEIEYETIKKYLMGLSMAHSKTRPSAGSKKRVTRKAS